MNNESLRLELNSLERKVKLLLSEHEQLKRKLVSLEAENEGLTVRLSKRDDQLSHFQNQMKISKIVKNMVVDVDNTSELKGVIDEYIKEIDKCIAQLSEA